MQHQTYDSITPWIIRTYPISDAEADANGGQSKIIQECCICGKTEETEFILPPESDPIWEILDPNKGLPAMRQIVDKFQLTHLHPDQHENPMLRWQKPLLNIAALTKGINLEQLAERLKKGIDPENK